MKVEVKKLTATAQVPQYQTRGSAGFDLVADEDVVIPAGSTKTVTTGLSVAVPKGYALDVRPRSGNSLNTYMRVANAPGTIDSDYRGELKVIIWNAFPAQAHMVNENNSLKIKKGDRIAQGVLIEVAQAEFEVVTELDQTERGASGFGSTGA